MRSIQRDQSVSSGIQRPVVREPLIGYALQIDGVPVLSDPTLTPTLHQLILYKQQCVGALSLVIKKSHFVVYDAE